MDAKVSIVYNGLVGAIWKYQVLYVSVGVKGEGRFRIPVRCLVDNPHPTP